MIREQMRKYEIRYEQITGESAKHVPIRELGAFLDGYDAAKQEPYEKFESAKDHIYKLASDYKCWDNRLTHDEALELCHILEKQEPCEDCISRQAVLEWCGDINMDVYTNEVKEYVLSLPSVNPQPKMQEVGE